MYGIFCILFVQVYLSLASGVIPRLVGGFEVPFDSILYHASLQNLTGHHVCGGAIVSLNHVITAAHCVQGANPQFIKIVVGTTNLNNGGNSYDVESIIAHHGYDSKLRIHDIAVLKSKNSFEKKSIDVLDLYKDELKEDDLILLTGFGAAKPHGESSRQMHALKVSVFSQETCRYAMRYTRYVSDTMFCTFTNIGQGTCHGDSGGPIIKDNRLAGLVAWGIPCAVGFPDVHTRIRPYVEWIQRTIKG